MPLKITRRQFLTYSAAAVAIAGIGWRATNDTTSSLVTPHASLTASLGEKIVPTVCALCASSCGLTVRVVNNQAVKIEGNPLHPINQGVCCPKGQAALEVLYSPERLRAPLLLDRATRTRQEISWDAALDLAAAKMRDLRARGQAQSFAFRFGETRGQMRALIRRFVAAFGSPNALEAYDTDAQAARLAMFLMQGVHDLPVYQWENTRYVLAFGGSFLEAGRHLLPALSGAGFMRRSTPRRGKFVVIDPRFSVSAAKADEWIPLRPGTLGAFALGIAHVMIRSNLYDEKFVRDFTFGFDDFKDDAGATHRGFKNLVLEEYTLDRVEAITGVPSGTIARLAGEFAASRPAVALLPTGRAALASGNALASAMAIHALNALAGSIDAPGGVIVQRYPKLADFPAQNAITGERVDGAGSRDFPLALSVAGPPRSAPSVLFLYNANPVFDHASADALASVPFVVSFSPTLDESAQAADLVLPISTFLESWSDAYVEGTGYAGIAVGQPAVAALYDSRSAGDALLALAQRIGGSVAAALPFTDYESLLKNRVAGSQIKWDDLTHKGAWSQMVYFNATPGSKVWNAEIVGRDRINAPRDGRFDFFAREMFYALKSAGIAPRDRDCLPHFDLPIATAPSSEFPFLLTLHETMTQPRGWSGIVPTMQEIYGLQAGVRWDSWVELNARAAAALGIKDGDLVWVESPRDKLQARAKLTQGLWPNAAAMPLGQGHRTRVAWGRETPRDTSVGANALALCARETEKWSGLAAGAPTRVKIYKVA
ncbi:MAG: molybdopterin-dependent oxidoreductase [Chloroflexi bacterium]|nr:molybdopterin-dependent oxidoreductase [Chloroflexota bacterium]